MVLVKEANEVIAPGKEEKLISLLPSEVYSIFREKFGFKTFTPVQRDSIKQFLLHKDVIVQSPTGSGKTLAYLLSVFAILLKVKQIWLAKETAALILVPNRELALQIFDVANHFGEALNIRIRVLLGGKKSKYYAKKVADEGVNVLIATPGRLEHLIVSDGNFKKSLKSLEILIVDEADRFTESVFKRSLNEILLALPKQRRTGLFSATQAKQLEELLKFGLRDAVQITITDSQENEVVFEVTPSCLQNYYAVMTAEKKLMALIEFIRSQVEAKILVFFSTCFCVAYMKTILPVILNKRRIFAIHGKKKKNREHQVQLFRSTPKAIMLSTDVMSRGIDIPDIDWVVQFDIPKQSSWFIHRSGRSGRCGREGKSLLFLTPNQDGYITFLQKYEKISLNEMKIPNLTAVKAEQLRQKIIKMASKDRLILERGTSAFVSFIESYLRHDCSVVCPFKELDVVGHAHSYGLLRLPKMKELKGLDLTSFKRSNIDTAIIKFKDKNREKQRQMKLVELRKNENVESTEIIPAIKKIHKSTDLSNKRTQEKEKTTKKRKMNEDEDKISWEETANDFALLKKIRRGRVRKKDIDLLI